MGIGDEKVALRNRYRRERKERYLDHSFEDLATSQEFEAAKVISSYFSYGDEPQTSQLNSAIIKSGKVLLLPRISGAELEWVQWDGQENSLNIHKKISEPIGERFHDLQAIDLIVVPALRIDRSGYRLGQGGGYYDRAFPKFSAWKIGLVYAGELNSEELPHEAHDIPLDAAASPSIIVRFNR
jgi:5-formyltetrahydrofolate cyclo-ligase